MLGRENKKCSLCHQIKPVQLFPTAVHEGLQPLKTHICFECQKNLAQGETGEDEGGSGGKQLQQNRDAKHLQYEMELNITLQKELNSLNQQKLDKNRLGMLRTIEGDQKTQTAQRELLNQKEETAKAEQDNQPNNPDYSKATETKREKITRLFSVTRHLASNYLASNLAKERNARAILAHQKNFFTHAMKESAATQTENLEATSNAKKTLSTESSTLFAPQHSTKLTTTETIDKLEAVIREAQNIFKR